MNKKKKDARVSSTDVSKLLFVNAQSLKSKSELMTRLLCDEKPDFFAVTESWLNPSDGEHIVSSICQLATLGFINLGTAEGEAA